MHNCCCVGLGSHHFIPSPHHNAKDRWEELPRMQNKWQAVVHHILLYCFFLRSVPHHDFDVCQNLPHCQEKNKRATRWETERVRQLRQPGEKRQSSTGGGRRWRWRVQRVRSGGGWVLVRWERQHLLLPDEKDEREGLQSYSSEAWRGACEALSTSGPLEGEAVQREALHVCSGRGHGGVCSLLVPVLLHVHTHHRVRRRLHPGDLVQNVLLVRLLQQLAQSHHIHRI